MIKMNEKKEPIKVSLGTVICIFIIILLIIALGIVYYIGFIKNKNDDVLPMKPNITFTEQENSINNTMNFDYQVNASETNIIKNSSEDSNKCYTDGKYYYLMLYKTNIGTKNSESEPAREQRRFCLMVNSGYGSDELYGWYNIENEQINLILSNSYNYDTVNNIANMMTQENNIKVKEINGQYMITLNYNEKNIKYGGYDLKLKSN